VLEREVGRFPSVSRVFVPVLCNHCEQPKCAEVCPTKATAKRADGIVHIDYEKCIGCCACIEHCPYHVRTLVLDNRTLYPDGKTVARVLLVGLGEVEKVTAASLRRSAMIAGKRARVLGAPTAQLLHLPEMAPGVDAGKAGQSLAEGLPFGAWHYPDLKRPPETPKPKFESAEIVIAIADAAFAACEQANRLALVRAARERSSMTPS
jgi:ferredoxin